MKTTKTSKSAKKSNVEKSNVCLISVAKQNSKEVEKIEKQKEREKAKEQKNTLRNFEKLDKAMLLEENGKISTQLDILKKYILNGYMENVLNFYGYKTKNEKRDLLNSITTKMLFSVAPYKAVENGKVIGQLTKRKLVLREKTDEQSELFTNIYVRKDKHSLANVIDLFIKVLRRKHESISFKSEEIEMNLDRFLLCLNDVENLTIIEYKKGNILAQQTK